MATRRDFLKLSAGLGVATFGPQAAYASDYPRLPYLADQWRGLDEAAIYSGIVTSQPREFTREYPLPQELVGQLQGHVYRLGAGLYERGDQRRNTVIDADGMIRHLELTENFVIFKNRHIRTEKFVAEEKANRYLYPSFAMHAPGQWNFAWDIKTQAQVCPIFHAGRLFATDEIQPLVEIDPDNLSTIGLAAMDPQYPDADYYAHTKKDPRNNSLHLLSLITGMSGQGVRILSLDHTGEIRSRSEVIDTGMRSFHDWGITENHFVLLLHATEISMTQLGLAMAGRATLAQAMRFSPNLDTEVILIDRKSGKVSFRESFAEALQSWHFVNSFENEFGQVVIDFIASNRPNEIYHPNSSFHTIMTGSYSYPGPMPASVEATRLRRFVADLERRRIEDHSDQTRAPSAIEMPQIPADRVGRDYRFFYAIKGVDFLQNTLVKYDMKNHQHQEYDFGSEFFISEPMFIDKVGASSEEDDGFVLVDFQNGRTRKNGMALFDARAIHEGPIWEVLLDFHMPLAFHGTYTKG